MKEYLRRLGELKSDIIAEINYLIVKGETRTLKEPVYVTYLDGKCVVSYTCEQVGINNDGMLFLGCINECDNGEREVLIKGEMYYLDVKSLYYLLNEISREVRGEMVVKIKEIVKSNGGKLSFSGDYPFQVEEQSNAFCQLKAICLRYDGELFIEDEFEGDRYNNYFSELSIYDLNLILRYAKEVDKKKTFRVWVRGSFSRDFDIEAESEEEAFEKAKEEWKKKPLYEGDSNGEDWDIEVC
jgi:hypothetical protein